MSFLHTAITSKLYELKGPGGSVVQCSARGLKVMSLILAHSSFSMRGLALINPSRAILSITT